MLYTYPVKGCILSLSVLIRDMGKLLKQYPDPISFFKNNYTMEFA